MTDMPLQKKLLLAIAVAVLLQFASNFAQYWGEVHDGGTFGLDFTGFWRAGQKVVQGNAVSAYDPAAFTPNAEGLVIPCAYPPHLLLLLPELGLMTYNNALLLWLLLPLPFYYWLLMRFIARSPLATEGQSSRRMATAAVLAFSLTFLEANIFTGQAGALTSVLFMTVAVFWESSPVVAGIALAFLTVKPPLCVATGLALLAARRWRLIAVAGATTLVLLALATACFGMAVWPAYFDMSRRFAEYMSHDFSRFAQLAIAPYISLRKIGLPVLPAGGVQAAISASVAAVILKVFRDSSGPWDLRFGLLACATILIIPYVMCYDTPFLMIAVLPLFARIWRDGLDNLLEVLCFIAIIEMPFAQPILSTWPVPVGMLSVVLLFVVLFRRYRIERATQSC